MQDVVFPWQYSRLVVEVFRSHARPLGLLWASDRLVAEAATYTAYNKYNVGTSILSAGFEPVIPAIKESQAYAVDRTTNRPDWKIPLGKT